MLNPFSQSCEIVGAVEMGDEYRAADLEPFIPCPLDSCPTLLLPSAFMPDGVAESFYARMVAPLPYGYLKLTEVRKFPGDPWRRISADIELGLKHHRNPRILMLAAGVNSTVVAGENLTVGSTVWLPAESLAPGR